MTQTIIDGKNSYLKITDILKKSQPNKLMVVGNGIKHCPKVKKLLNDTGISYVRFNDFKPNPTYEEIEKGIELFNAEQCDYMIAFGGGSAIDVAKCIKLFCRLDPTNNYLKQTYKDNHIPLIAMPTTAGTGSESTSFAVLYQNEKKYSVEHTSILPDFAILVHEVLRSLPIYQKKCTLLDALCQAIEAWWSVKSTDESKKYSQISIEMIMKSLDAYLNNYDDETAKEIMLAANFAGRAINITKTTAPHAMSYKLTSMFGLPHGHSVALCLPKVWRYMINNTDKCTDQRGSKYLSKLFGQISSAFNSSEPEEAIYKFETLLANLKIRPPQKANENEIKQLCDSVNLERMKNNPVTINEKALNKLYTEILST